MFKKIGIIIVALSMVTGVAFAGTEDDPPVKETKEQPSMKVKKKKTKTVYVNAPPKPQPGVLTIESSYIRRVPVGVPVED